MIQLIKCSKLFGQSLALDSIDLEIDGKGLILVLGGNGAGKSTLLRTCAGLVTPSSGVARVFPTNAYFGHNTMLYPDLTVKENLSLFAALSDEHATDSAVGWLKIPEIEDRLVGDLSQGQKARAGLARALFKSERKWLMLDEPGAAFDRYWQKLLISRLKEIAGTGLVLLVTHDPEHYIAFASRSLILSRSKLIDDRSLNSDADRSSALEIYAQVLR